MTTFKLANSGEAYRATLVRTELNNKTGWTFNEYSMAGGNISISGNCDIDELRLYPKQSRMSTSCYEPNIGVIASCNAENRISYYEYDGLNRLKLIKDQDKNIIKYFCYNFKGEQNACLPAGCPKPVIQNITASGRNLTVYYTPSPGAGTCATKWVKVTTGESGMNHQGCNSPRTMSLPSAGTFKVIMVSYHYPNCPQGVESDPVEITVN